MGKTRVVGILKNENNFFEMLALHPDEKKLC
jgi:hypothetical protein